MAGGTFLMAVARRLFGVLLLFGVSIAAATVFAVPRSTHVYGDIVLPTGDLRVAAAIALVLVGVSTWLDRPGSTRGGLAILAGLVTLAPEWEHWFLGPPELRSLAMVVQPFALPLVAHLVLGEPSGRITGRWWRVAVGIGYIVAAIAAVASGLFRDPFLDPACLLECRYNVFLVGAQPGLVRGLDLVVSVGTLLLGLGLVVASARRLSSGTRAAAALRWPVLAPGVLIGGATAVDAGLRLAQEVPQPRDLPFAALSLVESAGLLALAVGSLLVLWRTHGTRAAVARLAAELGEAPPPGSLATVLARATGDSTLEVVYPLPGGDGYIDASGRTVESPSAGPGRAVTPVARRGRPVAFIVHDAAALDADEIRRDVGAAARLAVENERLQAESLARLADLRASRVRLVEAADAERRRLERDLHDGAQQRLLALGFDLRRAAATARRGDGSATEPLASAIAEADEAINELRDLAHGIYPAVLTGAGIGPALMTLTDSGAVALEVREAPSERFVDAVERTVFEVVTETLAEAARVGSERVAVRVARDGDDLVVEVDGTGAGPFTLLADRVGALGGRIDQHGSRLRAEIPCGS